MIGEHLARRGHEVRVLTTEADDLEAFWHRGRRTFPLGAHRHGGVEIERFSLTRLPRQQRVLRLLAGLPLGWRWRLATNFPTPLSWDMWRAAAAGAEGADIIHAGPVPYDFILLCALRAAEAQGVPLVVTPFLHLGLEGPDGRAYRREAQAQLLRKARLVCVQTGIEREYLEGRGVSPDRIRQIGVGVDIEAVAGGRGDRFRRKHGLGREFVVLFLGSKSVAKGVGQVAQAAAQLREEGLAVRAVLAGYETEEYRHLRAAWGGAERAAVLDLQAIPEADKRDALDACDVLALPSRSESFGMVFLEAWAYGKPVIGARAGAIPYVVDDGSDGLLVPHGDARALAEALRRLHDNAEQARALGQAGRRKVHERFTRQHCATCFEDAVKEVLAAESGRPDPRQ